MSASPEMRRPHRQADTLLVLVALLIALVYAVTVLPDLQVLSLRADVSAALVAALLCAGTAAVSTLPLCLALFALPRRRPKSAVLTAARYSAWVLTIPISVWTITGSIVALSAAAEQDHGWGRTVVLSLGIPAFLVLVWSLLLIGVISGGRIRWSAVWLTSTGAILAAQTVGIWLTRSS